MTALFMTLCCADTVTVYCRSLQFDSSHLFVTFFFH